MSEWNAMTYEGKDTILRVVRDEAERMFALAEDPDAWDAPTACDGWTTADIVGHIVDTTEGYFSAFDAARGKGEVPAPHGLPAMARAGERGRDGVPRRPAGGDDGAAAHRLRQDAGHPRAARSGRVDRLDGHPPLHGPGPGVLLRGWPADGLRRALVGHPPGQWPGARPVR